MGQVRFPNAFDSVVCFSFPDSFGVIPGPLVLFALCDCDFVEGIGRGGTGIWKMDFIRFGVRLSETGSGFSSYAEFLCPRR